MVTKDMIPFLMHGVDPDAKVVTIFDYDSKNFLVEISEEPSNEEASRLILVSKKKGETALFNPLEEKDYERKLMGKKPLYTSR